MFYPAGRPHRHSVDAMQLLREMVSHDECFYDHDNYCQTHYRHGPCPHEKAQKLFGIEPR